MRNMFDDAYVLGYASGYHGDEYTNSYDKDTEAQWRSKFENGYADGVEMKEKELDRDQWIRDSGIPDWNTDENGEPL